MNEANRTQAIIDLLADRTTPSEVARTFGVTEPEVALWKTLYLDGAAGAIARPKKRALPKMPAWVLAPAVTLLVAGGYVGHVRSQAGCAQTLPAPLVTFCAGQPVVASQMNGNFQQIVSWIQNKVGAVGAAGVSTTTVSATSVSASSSVTANTLSGAYTPAYQSWGSSGEGAGGAAIYNDSGSFQRLMIVGNSSGGGNRRRVGLWDDVNVAANLSAGANFSAPNNSWDGAYYTGGNGYSYGSEPTTDGWARGRQACNNVQSYSCPNGQYVCGIEFWHGCGWSWYDEVTRVRCCSL